MHNFVVRLIASFIPKQSARRAFREYYTNIKDKTIHICMITDDNYVVPTMVAVCSMATNKIKYTKLVIHVLGDNLSLESINKLNSLNRFKAVSLDVMDKYDLIQKYKNIEQSRHVTPAALLKFFLPKIFNNYDKILYLDSDILIQGDLAKLYNTDIHDKYAAVIKDTLCVVDRIHMEKLQINNPFYFNSGVMLLNLKKMRNDNINEKLIDYRLNVPQIFMDQDAFNAIIGHNVKFVSWKYNFLNYYMMVMNFRQLSEFFDDDFTNKPFWKIYDSATILHLGGKEKPWNEDMGYLSVIYRKYYDLLCNSKTRLKWFYKNVYENGRVHIYFKGFKIASYKRYISEYTDALKRWFYDVTGHNLNLENPQTFNEKIQWLKLYDSTPIKTKLADKLLVRDWVAKKIGNKYLIPLLGVYDSFDEIDFDKLPNQFVIKCNHGSGWNIIVSDKNKFDKTDAKRKIDDWMSRNYAFNLGYELHYLNIKPKIIIEEFVSNDGKALWDYKFWCFNGDVKYMQFRDDFSPDLRMVFYDMSWNKQHFCYDHPLHNETLEKPDNFDEMVKIARKLSKGFAVVCVDLYRLNNGEIKFGEMTFTRSSGIGKWNDEKYNKMLGDMIKLPNKSYDIKTGRYYMVNKN